MTVNDDPKAARRDALSCPAHHRDPRARIDPDTKAYLARKRAERKTTAEALRFLKRYIARPFTTYSRYRRPIARDPPRSP